MMPLERTRTAALAALRPPARLPLDEWMESTVRLPAGVAAVPGRVRLWPYQRGIAQAISDPGIERVTLLKPVRVGFTTLLTGAVGHFVRNEPAPIICLLPTEDDARGYLADEIEPIFAATPALETALSEDIGGRDTMLSRRFAGGSLRIIAAKSQRNLRRRTPRVLLIDEADGMEAGPEGDPITLAEKRTLTFADRKIVLGSSPVHIETSRVIRAYGKSDQRVFECPCPECGAFTEIQWEHIVWQDGKPETAAFLCPHCETVISERHKPAMVDAGEWRATKPEIKDHAGFRLNALVSLLKNASWAKLAAEFLESKKNPDTLQTFVNTILAQGWDGGGEEIDPAALKNRAEGFSLDNIPEAVRIMTAGVDVQRDRLEIGYLGWTENGEILILGNAVVWGDPHNPETWGELDDVLRQRFAHPLGGTLGLDATGIDSGDGETSAVVLDFCRGKAGRRIYALKGAGGAREAIKLSKSRKHRLFIVGVDSIKGRIAAMLTAGRGMRFSDTLEDRFFEELTAEKRQIRYRKGAPIVSWERTLGRRAEALDCTVYGIAVRELVKAEFSRREAQLRETPESAPKRSRVIRSKWMEGRA